MIKLSVFMLDPVRAHELYVKEIQALEAKLEKQSQAQKDLKKHLKVVQEKLKQSKSALGVVSKKLGEERKQNEIWEN